MPGRKFILYTLYRMYPSFMAHVMSGILLFVSIAVFFLYYSQIKSKGVYSLLIILLLLSIASAAHGISHLGMEVVYNYNPLR
jgi:hypothetical protein